MQDTKTVNYVFSILIAVGLFFATMFIIATDILHGNIVPGAITIGAFELLVFARGPQAICDFVYC